MNPSDDPNFRFRIEPPLPARVAVGRANQILVQGSCEHARRRIRAVELELDGQSCRAMTYPLPRRGGETGRAPQRSGFIALLSLRETPEPRRLDLRLTARLAGGGRASAHAARIEALPGPRRAHEPPPGGDPLVAICMATFDPPAELVHAQIASIRAQSYGNWTCIVSDDGSRPQALEAVREAVADDPRFRVERNERRLGVYRNFERLLELVPPQASFVALADQDDRWQPDKLASLVGQIGADATLAYSDARVVGANGRQISQTFWSERANNPDDLARLVLVNSITGGAALFRSELLDYVLPFPATEGLMHDHWIAIVAMSLGSIAYLDRPLYDYVQHGGAALGHESARRTGRAAPALTAIVRKGLLERLRRYYYIALSVRSSAELALLRGKAIPPRKRRALRRCASLGRSPLAVAWLTWLALSERVGRSRTLGVERVMLAGTLWPRAARAASFLRLGGVSERGEGLATMLQLPHGAGGAGSGPEAGHGKEAR